MVLLDAMARVSERNAITLSAVHVDHGISRHAGSWAEFCAAQCAQRGLPLTLHRVKVTRERGRSLEALARSARYERLLAEDVDVVALAHHADDQAETVLLKLLRGAGPEGLGGMRALRAFGRGWLWRPLLELPRASLRAYADAHALRWIDDPSNANTSLRRNFVRAEILPRLAQRWPDASTAIAHSARWSRAAADFVAQQAQLALVRLQGLDPSTLAWAGWLELPDALRDPVLRLWLRGLGLAEPAHFQVGELERQLGSASEDAAPCVRWDGCELRRYRGLVHALRPLPEVPDRWQAEWTDRVLALPCGGELAWARDEPGLDAEPRTYPALVVRFRNGGERLRPAGSAHTRELRTLLQEHGVPPWQRERIPLIYAGDELIAAGDLFISARARELGDELHARIIWTA